jgi:hypothetical protein
VFFSRRVSDIRSFPTSDAKFCLAIAGGPICDIQFWSLPHLNFAFNQHEKTRESGVF